MSGDDESKELPSISISLDDESTKKSANELPAFFAGRYQIVSLLGEGGMGRIYKAYDEVLQRLVALKFVIADDPDHEQRLMREAQAQARLEHDHICKIFDLGKAEGRTYIAMQYVDGNPLDQESERLGLEQKVRLIRQVAEGVHAAHEMGLIHRDVKPSNLMVERTAEGDLRPCILDFGLVKDLTRPDKTRTGLIHGTPHYMSPEQATGEELDRRTDVYSLGATLYKLLTDKLPHEGSIVEVLMKLMEEDPPAPRQIKPSIPRDLENIVLKSMEKKREGRYQSARELAHDLDRYLRGEPVLARPIGPAHRLLRKVQRHKATSAIMLVAFLFALSFTVIGMRAHFSAQRQAALAQEFGQVVKEIQGIMRYAYMLPLHSVERERAIVVERMSWIEKQMKDVGRIGQGPGHYALGSGNHSLQETERAFDHLQKAWQNGYQEPEVAYLLGLVTGEMYQSALEETERIPDPKLRMDRAAKLEKEYRNPALDYLKLGEKSRTESKEFVEGLLAFYEKDWERTLKQAEVAVEKIPWLYEARQLQGNVYLSRGRERMGSGSNKEAANDFEKGEEHFRLAAEMASSDSRIYENICRLRSAVMSLHISTGQDPQPSYESAINACKKALVADPHRGEAHDQLAYLHIQWARSLIDRGLSPQETLERSLHASEEAKKKMSGTASAHNSAGMANWLLSEYAMYHGQDPSGFLNTAILEFDQALKIHPNLVQSLNYKGNCYLYLGKHAVYADNDPTSHLLNAEKSYQEAIRIEPKYVSPYSNLGITYWELGMNAMNTGRDPRDWLRRSIESNQSAVKINPNNATPYNSMGTSYGILGSYAIAHGENPGALLEKSINSFTQAAKIKPDWPYPHNNIGLGHLDKAKYAELMEADPSQFLGKAKDSLNRAIELNPQYGEAWMNLGTVHARMAQYRLERNLSPLESLNDGEVSFGKALQSLGEDPDLLSLQAEMELIRARWQMKTNASPQKEVDKVSSTLSRAIQLKPNSENLYRILAELHYRQAAWRAARRVAFSTDLEQGLKAVEKALSLNSSSADAYAIQGLFYLLQSRFSVSATDRIQPAHNAENALQKAIEINPNLKLKYQDSLKEAQAVKRNQDFDSDAVEN